MEQDFRQDNVSERTDTRFSPFETIDQSGPVQNSETLIAQKPWRASPSYHSQLDSFAPPESPDHRGFVPLRSQSPFTHPYPAPQSVATETGQLPPPTATQFYQPYWPVSPGRVQLNPQTNEAGRPLTYEPFTPQISAPFTPKVSEPFTPQTGGSFTPPIRDSFTPQAGRISSIDRPPSPWNPQPRLPELPENTVAGKVPQISPKDREAVDSALQTSSDVQTKTIVGGAYGALFNSGIWALDKAAHAGKGFSWWEAHSPFMNALKAQRQLVDDLTIQHHQLASQVKLLPKGTVDRAEAKTAALLASEQLKAARNEFLAMDKNGPLAWPAVKTGFIKGAVATAGTITAGYLADKYLFGNKNAEFNRFDQFLLDGAAGAALLMPGDPKVKGGCAAGLFLLARAKSFLEKQGPSLSQSNTLLRPNGIDTFGFTAAALAPLDAKSKMAIAGTTLVTGRLWNLAAHQFGWDGGSNGLELRDASVQAIADDLEEKTRASFDRAVESTLALSRHKAGEGAVLVQINDFVNNPDTQRSLLNYYRGHAALLYAQGLSTLEKGSRIVEKKETAEDYFGENARILKDAKFDFLGESTVLLSAAFADLTDLRLQVHKEKLKLSADASLPDQAKQEKLNKLNEQTKFCDDERQEILGHLKKLFGPQDIKKVYAELGEAYKYRSKDMDTLISARKQTFDTFSNKVNPEMRAKLARDLTLAYLVAAQYRLDKDNGGSAQTEYIAAEKYLNTAISLDPGNPNLDKIKDIAAGIKARIPASTSAAYQSWVANPFQVQENPFGAGQTPFGIKQ